MTFAPEHFIVDEHIDLRERLALFLRGQFPRDGAKRLAQAINCDPRTAESILLAKWPNAYCWRGIVRAFGRDVLAAVFEPDIQPVLARLTAEERLLEQQLHEARARRRQAQGLVEGGSDRLDETAEGRDPLTLDLFEGRLP
jgi:hypothetical protein